MATPLILHVSDRNKAIPSDQLDRVAAAVRLRRRGVTDYGPEDIESEFRANPNGKGSVGGLNVFFAAMNLRMRGVTTAGVEDIDAELYVRDAERRAEKAERELREAEERAKRWEDAHSHLMAGQAGTPSHQPTETRFQFCDSEEFDDGDFEPRWLIEEILVADEPYLVAGLSKTLKTSIAVDQVISLASGKAALGRFRVPESVRVAIISGESGRATLQSAGRRIAESKGTTLRALKDRLYWCFDVPALPDVGQMTDFADQLAERKVEFAPIDPFYMTMPGIDMKNMFEAGPVLLTMSNLLRERGITPAIVHHSNRTIQVGEPMQLTHVAFSGLDQFARQFLLINRREKYAGDGTHQLWLSTGGSAFTGRIWGADIDEGQTDNQFRGRKWEVTVRSAAELGEAGRVDREAKKDAKARQRMTDDETAVLQAIDAERVAGHAGATVTAIRKRHSNLSQNRVKEAAERLCEGGIVEWIGFEILAGNGSKRSVFGWRRPLDG